MSLAKKLGMKMQVQQIQKPVWKGPHEDGITYSLLCRWLNCKERFRLYAIEGWTTEDHFNKRIEYGNMWHLCEEKMANREDWLQPLLSYCRDLCQRYRLEQEEILKWYNVCKIQFAEYVKFWAEHEDVIDRKPVFQEHCFRVPYTLPSGRTVILRGKWDAVDIIGRGRDRGLYLQENKTKGEVDEVQIKRQLTFDLQTMLYIIALWEAQSQRMQVGLGVIPSNPIRGVRYNVIRRPLSGGKGTIRQKNNETLNQYYERLRDDYIAKEPETYFFRWKVDILPSDVERFKHECLDPMLEALCNWWDWVSEAAANEGMEGYSTDPFLRSHLHHRHPYGVFNIMDDGGSTEYDEYLASGSVQGLRQTDNLFPELT